MDHVQHVVRCAISVLVVMLSVAAPASAQTPVAAYAFDEGAGTTVADATGNGNTGTITGATWTTAGMYGGALVFNGTTARVRINDSPALRLTTGMTLEAWVKPSTIPNAWRDVIYKGNDNYFLEATAAGTSAPAAGGTFGSTGAEVYATAPLIVSTWAHLAATYDGATLRLYVNGSQVASVARTGNLATSANPLEIGGDSIYGQFFQGTIDEVRVYNVALTAAQIQTDMNTPVGRAGPATADLTLTKAHSGSFAQGQTGAAYTLTARNSGTGPTSGTVTVTDTLPGGLTATAMSGTGWSCTVATLTCTRSDALAGGGSYPAITLAVNVASTAPASVTNSASVSGGADANTSNNTATDPTTITTSTSGGLIAAYSFNEGSGTSVADASGHGLSGTIGTATWTSAGKYGGALVFNGTTARVTINDSALLHFTTAMTLEAWVRPAKVTNKWRDVIYKGNDNYFLEATSQPGSRPAAGGTFGSTRVEVKGTAALTANAWAHLAATYDGATLRLYVNGAQVASVARTGNLAISANPLEIGGDSIYGQFFQGTIDDVRVYNVALTAAQIQTDMNTPVGPATTDSQPPNTPGGLTASAIAANQINLAWTASTDNVAVTGYTVERCQGAGCGTFTTIASPGGTATTYSDTGLTANTSYSYRVRATDAAGNLSNYSNPASATTPGQQDVQPPSAPGTLTATALSGTRVSLTWGAATDNIGVTNYRVERCLGAGCSSFVKLASPTTTTYTDTNLTPNTTYNYIVRAEDGAGNLGPYSNVAAVTTSSTTPELVAAYSFDQGSGTTVADASGNGNTGTIVNATWTTAGKYGSALAFNGTNARVSVPDAASLHLSTAMTLEAWVKPSTVTSVWRDVIYKGNDNYYLESSSDNGSRPAVGGTFAGVNANVYGTTALAANTWSHLAATYDGAVLRLYVNGVEASNLPRTGAFPTSTNPVEIGGDSLFGQYFQGTIDEVRIYNVSLTPTQIQTDMNSPTGGGSLPAVSLDRSSIDFGSQTMGTASSAQAATLTNTGGASLSVASIAITGVNSADFAQTNTCGSSLAPAASCTISTVFTPGAIGARTAAVTITDNAPGSPHTIALTGTGVGSGAGFSVIPSVSVLTPGLRQQFAVSDPNVGAVTWSVDGTVGGTTSAGTITTSGLYSPPSAAGTHTVTATTSDQLQSSSATVYVTNHPGVFTHHNDNARTGQNLNETVLTQANVNASSFGKLRSYSLDGMAMASPLYVANVNIPGQGVHNVVYVATQHNTVYAFDADGLSASPLWQRSFINPAAGVTSVPASDTGECCDIAPEIGITGTPAIDPSTGTLYVVAKTKEVSGSTTNYVQRLHALDITSGAEKFGGPVILQASVPGSGQGSQAGSVPFDALHENQRPALLLNNGVVYIGFGSHGDNQPYHGWVLGYNASTLQRVMALNVSPNTSGGGIWQANGGLASDAAGNIYFITGNGPFTANTGSGKEYGNTFLKMSPAGAVLDFFTPSNQATLDANNWDLGAAGPMLLPDQSGAHPHLLVSAGKNNTVYLVDRDNMGHYNANGDSQVVQALVNIFPFGTPEPGNYSAPVYFNGTVYFGPVADAIQAFRLTNGLLSTSATSRSVDVYSYPGASLAISARGTANGILWAVERKGDCGPQVTCGTAAPGVLRAYDPANLATELYASDQSGSRDTLDYAAKFSVPLIVNGKVFVASMSKLTIYGLLP